MPSDQSSGTSVGSPGPTDVLIAGGGQAAVHLASALREFGWQSAVTIVSEEPHPPYQRPPLSKAFLSSNADPATLEFHSAEHYARERITVLTGPGWPAGRGGPPVTP
jgi:3-phenylpropionate/trans-cinnamate dioxygenase ferredoxin reductase subunit